LKMICQRGSSIVWCPTSNLFTLGRTLTAETVRSGVSIALGTDSALTGEGDLLDEMKPAVALVELRPEMVMVCGNPMLMSDSFTANPFLPDCNGFDPIHIEGRGSWLIRADVPGLYDAASAAIGQEVRLAGKLVWP
jgi:hypothetical protein